MNQRRFLGGGQNGELAAPPVPQPRETKSPSPQEEDEDPERLRPSVESAGEEKDDAVEKTPEAVARVSLCLMCVCVRHLAATI